MKLLSSLKLGQRYSEARTTSEGYKPAFVKVKVTMFCVVPVLSSHLCLAGSIGKLVVSVFSHIHKSPVLGTT